jgi:Ser/Thr protein kinase RdoA (MazF antagonist)
MAGELGLPAALGLRDVREIAGGHQSVGVYAARCEGRQIVLKLVDAQHADLQTLKTRLHLLCELGAAHDAVCRPVALAGRLVNELRLDGAGLTYAVAYDLADGDAPEITDPEHAARMGRALAELHASMSELPRFDLPPLASFPPGSELVDVAAELGVPLERLPDPSSCAGSGARHQLLHGDFSWKNVRFDGSAVRVFDFDDCGYGPVELDVALSLYMVLFGAMTGPDPVDYTTFRNRFLSGYQDGSGAEISEATLDGLITYRVLVLASWLARPASGLVGVRAASDEWRATLRQFIEDYVEAVVRP